MNSITRKQKVFYIIAAVGFLILAVAFLAFLLGGKGSSKKEEVPLPEITPVPVSTSAPAVETVVIGGKEVEKETDSFYLSGRPLSPEDEAQIAALSQMTTLSLSGCSITDISFLSGCTSLRTLYLTDNRIASVAPLASLVNLRSLYLDGNPVTDLSPLAALPSLTTLSLKGVSIADYILEDMQAAMPNCRIFNDSVVESARPISLGGLAFTEDIEALDLSHRGVFDISKLSYCLRLADLNLSGNPVENLSVLSGLPALRRLSLAEMGLTDNAAASLQALEKLEYLDIRGNEFSAEAIDAIRESLPNTELLHDTVYYRLTLGGQVLSSDMTEIALSFTGISSLEGLEKFEALRVLRVGGNSITDISPLQGLMQLEELDLGSNQLSGISQLSGHTALKALNLSRNSITDIYALASCTGLTNLDLSYNSISYISHLESCTSLLRLDLTGNPDLTAEQILRLQEVLPACEIITDIPLWPIWPEIPPEAVG